MTARRRAWLRGEVQGVGLRPYVARLAARHGLAGFVANAGRGAVVEVEGPAEGIAAFAVALRDDAPPAVSIVETHWEDLPTRGEQSFRIAPSAEQPDDGARLGVAPDARVCAACWAEVCAPDNRRRGHPFATCTACGPRFSVARTLPYDRERTSMAAFPLCAACQGEYDDPGDRRYHAQGIACPECGPRIRVLDAEGATIASDPDWCAVAVQVLRRGETLALMGVGGFQLLVDARNSSAVARLRARKGREAKPLAVMVANVDAARRLASIEPAAAAALESAAGPIVVVPRRGDELAPEVAPDRSRLGLMLPTTPLHALLAEAFGGPLVATSGNREGEPIVRTMGEAQTQLRGIADAAVVHDRVIVRRCDDAVVQVVDGQPRLLRPGRGYAPISIAMPRARDDATILALGGHLKMAPAVARGGEAVLWSHVGDLHHPRAREAMAEAIDDLMRLSGTAPTHVACDAHPDYATTQWAEGASHSVVAVWHHHAHAAAVMAEHGVAKTLALTWDGVGLGPDGTGWGGEVLDVDRSGAARVGHLRPFAIPGGDAAARDGRLPLAGLLATAELEVPADLSAVRELPRATIPHLPRTTSVGRLFDAAAALTGLCPRSRYEGEAAARLEERVTGPLPPPYPVRASDGVLDWAPVLRGMLEDRHDASRVAGRLHATLARFAVDIAVQRRAPALALAGGCFANRVLTETIADELRARGITPLLATRVPCSDAGLAVGQAWVAAHRPELS